MRPIACTAFGCCRFLATMFILSAAIAVAQPVRVMPISAVGDSYAARPTGFWLVNGVLLFNLDGGVSGSELWRSDGTAAGTVPVKDVYTYLWPGLTVVSGNRIFFEGTSSAGKGLWVSDGTLGGTRLVWSGTVREVSDVGGTVFFTDDNNLYKTNGVPGDVVIVKAVSARSMMVIGSTVYFTGGTPIPNAYGLWKSDGTNAGTVLVKAFPPLSAWLGGIPHAGRIFFGADDGTNGHELWVSDGTGAGTVLLKDINPGSGHGVPTSFTSIGGDLYFTADDGVSGRELWKSDGTAAGTARVKDIRAGADPSNALGFAALGGQVVFSARTAAGWQVWKTDGSDGGTVMVKQMSTGEYSAPEQYTLANGALCFVAREDSGLRSLWRTDGTEAGTIEIMSGVMQGELRLQLASTGARVFFAKRTGTSIQVWSSDCTSPSGNVLVKDLPIRGVNNSGTYLNSLTSMDDHVMLSASRSDTGQELWRADASGGALVKDVEPGTGSGVPSPIEYVLGTPGGDYPVPGASLRDGRAFWFRGYTSGGGIELWRSDGTPGGTALVKDINPGTAGSSPRSFTKVGPNVFFYADDGVHGRELWKSDGTEAGTALVKDISPGAPPSNITSYDSASQLVNVNGTVYFRAYTPATGVELWKSDGTDAGTVMVKEITPGANLSGVGTIANLGGTVIFGATSAGFGYELWKSDGTDAGTVMVKDIRPGTDSGLSSGPIVVMNGFAYFFATGGDLIAGRPELWRSDGTSAGTTRVFVVPFGLQLERMAAVDGALYFKMNNFAIPGALYRSDGTPEGTKLLRTFEYASTAIDKGTFVGLNGIVYFIEQEPATGLSLWRTDGTPLGTYRIGLFPGFNASNPVELTAVGDRLYFIANDGENPRSLYYYVPRPPAQEITRLGNISSRGQVLTGDNVMIGGFIVGGPLPKTVVVRARGPSLSQFGVTNPLANPQMQLFSGPTQIGANDNWAEAANASAIQASGFAPSHPQESAILATLAPGAYTAIVTGVAGTTGNGIVEVFEVDELAIPLLNISTRGNVQTGDDVLIGGFVIQGSSPQKVMVRARGPSMAQQVTGVLADPQLQLFSGQTQIAYNDNWMDAPNAIEIDSGGKAPASPAESAILMTLQPGAYTAIVSGVARGTGVAIVEVFRVD